MSAQLIAEARELSAAGWSHRDIAAIFVRRGTPVHYGTVTAWLTPDPEAWREQGRRKSARRSARLSGGRLRTKALTPEFKQARLEGLRAAGVSVAAIVAVFRFDGLEPTLPSPGRVRAQARRVAEGAAMTGPARIGQAPSAFRSIREDESSTR